MLGLAKEEPEHSRNPSKQTDKGSLSLLDYDRCAESTTVTLLFTNDVESAYDPIPAFWLDDQKMIGGIAEMTTLIKRIIPTPRHTPS